MSLNSIMFDKIVEAFNKLKCKLRIKCCCISECMKDTNDEQNKNI